MKTKKKFTLDACPSCGKHARFAFRSFEVEVRVECTDCGLGTEWCNCREEAAEIWNDQPRIRRMDAEIARLGEENSALRSAMHELSGQVIKKQLSPDVSSFSPGPRSTQPDYDYSNLAYVRGPNNQPVPLKRCSKCGVMHPADEMIVVVGSPRRWICAQCDQKK